MSAPRSHSTRPPPRCATSPTAARSGRSSSTLLTVGREHRAQPSADAPERVGGCGELEVDEAVRLAAVAHLVDGAAVLPQSSRVEASFVPERIASSEDDDGRRQIAEGRRLQRRCERIVTEFAPGGVTLPKTFHRLPRQNYACELVPRTVRPRAAVHAR